MLDAPHNKAFHLTTGGGQNVGNFHTFVQLSCVVVFVVGGR